MVHNFSAGPSILPKGVFLEASKAVVEYKDTGLSLLEMSHRGEHFVEIMQEAQNLVKELLGLNDDFKVLFLSGGASTGFYISALNFLKTRAGYIDTGTWSSKAIKEAKRIAPIEVVASSKDNQYKHIPSIPSDLEGLDYLHITSNNTIYGTQFQDFQALKTKQICDMSSDIFSRPIDGSKFSLIYAGAQKNMGPAGTTLYIVNQNHLDKDIRDLPSMLDLSLQIEKKSAFNTPPVFPIYVSMLNLRWLKDNGGVEAAEKRNAEKADLLYAEIDRNSLFTGNVEHKDRSKMNVTFTLSQEGLENTFLDLCKQANIVGIKGHRSVGGFRASLYNALPLKSVQALVEIMTFLEQSHG